jgi:putative tricarboxylic transport membrane protein
MTSTRPVSFGSITTLAIALLFWPVIDTAFSSVGRLMRPARVTG